MEEIAFCGGALWDLKVETRAAALDTHAALFRDFLKQDGIYLLSDSPPASAHETSSDDSVAKAGDGEIKAAPFHANTPSDSQQDAP